MQVLARRKSREIQSKLKVRARFPAWPLTTNALWCAAFSPLDGFFFSSPPPFAPGTRWFCSGIALGCPEESAAGRAGRGGRSPFLSLRAANFGGKKNSFRSDLDPATWKGRIKPSPAMHKRCPPPWGQPGFPQEEKDPAQRSQHSKAKLKWDPRSRAGHKRCPPGIVPGDVPCQGIRSSDVPRSLQAACSLQHVPRCGHAAPPGWSRDSPAVPGAKGAEQGKSGSPAPLVGFSFPSFLLTAARLTFP